MRRFLPLIVVAVLLAGCAHLPHKAGPLALGEADSGRTVEMVVGQVATVRLASNLSTGYRWQATGDPDPRILIIEDSGYDRPAEKMPGAPEQSWWTLRATGAGTTTLVLRYVRPWEADEKAKEFSLTVTVK